MSKKAKKEERRRRRSQLILSISFKYLPTRLHCTIVVLQYLTINVKVLSDNNT